MLVPEDEVRAELDKVQSSRVFRSAKLLNRFLRFIVEQSIAGNTDSLKESILGIDLFGRGPDFDPRTDPIVRVDARRLRLKLTEYYDTEGANDRVIIELPRGHYTPVFCWGNSRDGLLRPGPLAAEKFLPLRNSVAVLPFVSINGDRESQYFSDGLTEEVITALARITGLRVIGRSIAYCCGGKAQDVRRVGRDLNVNTVMEGTVRRTGTRVRVIARLLNAADCFHLWSEAWEREHADILAVQTEISEAIENIARQMIHTQT